LSWSITLEQLSKFFFGLPNFLIKKLPKKRFLCYKQVEDKMSGIAPQCHHINGVPQIP
jgi:hypothetical protein